MSRYVFLIFLAIFISCNGKEELCPIKSKSLLTELDKYLERADEITSKEVKVFHLGFDSDGKQCILTITAENLYVLQQAHDKTGHFQYKGNDIYVYGLDSCSSDYIDGNLLDHKVVPNQVLVLKNYRNIDNLNQLYLVTSKGKLRRLAKA